MACSPDVSQTGVRLGEIPLEIQIRLLMFFSNFPFTRNAADDLAKADIMLEACAPSTIPYRFREAQP